MRIHKKVIIDIASNEVLYDDAFDYEGQIAECVGAGLFDGPDATPPVTSDPTVQKLNQQQYGLLQQSAADNAAMRPFILKSMGLTEDYTPEQKVQLEKLKQSLILGTQILGVNNLTGETIYGPVNNPADNFEKNKIQAQIDAIKPTLRPLSSEEITKGMTPEQIKARDLRSAYMDYQIKALGGQLPVDPALEENLGLQQGALNENLSRKLGANYALSTPGIQSADAFRRSSEALRQQSRQGMINTGQANIASQTGLLSGLNQANIGNYQNFSQPHNSLLQNYGQAQQPYQFYANMNNQNSLQNSANQAGILSAQYGMLGSVAGMGGAALMASSKDFKKDIVKLAVNEEWQILNDIKNTDIYTWKYKEEDEEAKSHIGCLTEEAPDKMVTNDGKHLDIISMLGMIMASMKVLANKVEALEAR